MAAGEPRGKDDVAVECGWGRLLFGHTFGSARAIADAMAAEEQGRRDICLYAPDPHVVVSYAPERLFIDPSHTFRLHLQEPEVDRDRVPGIAIRDLAGPADAEHTNRIYHACGMVPVAVDTLLAMQADDRFTLLVAEDRSTGEVVGSVMGVDHVAAFGDPEQGTSLWCLAVDPQAGRPGIGEALVRGLASRFREVGRAHLDLSVLHDNTPAIRLYEKLGFERVHVFAVKAKNPINERLFVASRTAADLEELNPYARVIADEALRRGIVVDVVDGPAGYLRLTHGGRSVTTRESLSELTTAVAMSRCDDKRVTRKVLVEHGLSVPRGREATFDEADEAFLGEVGAVVVKPARGEQGAGITVGVRSAVGLRAAVDRARKHCPDVLLEELVTGADLRVIVIDHEVVAAAERRPAEVIGDGRRDVHDLIVAQSRRRAAATGGESRIPLDEETRNNVAWAGWSMDDVPPEGEVIRVRGTANLHTGGTMHDVTDRLHPSVAEACRVASRALDMPVVGLDLMVPDVAGPEHVFIEANERPGLANHEPQPTAERFVDLLFPSTRASLQRWDPDLRGQGEDHRPGE